MLLNVYVLDAKVLIEILSECYDSLIVAIDNNGDQRISRSLKIMANDESLDSNDKRIEVLNLI